MQRHFLIVFLFFVAFFQTLKAQSDSTKTKEKKESNWKFDGAPKLTITQLGLYNWNSGGSSLLSIGGKGNFELKYRSEVHWWENKIAFGYGFSRQGEEMKYTRKNEDYFDVYTKYSYYFDKYFNFSVIGNITSQFDAGFAYVDQDDGTERPILTSKFFAPAYFTGSAGFEYKKKEDFFVFLSPITSKMTFVLDDTLSAHGDYGVEPGKELRKEFGAYIRSELKFKIMKNVWFKNTLYMFLNYETPDLIDIDWQTQLILVANKYIETMISTHLIYDDDIIITRKDGSKGPITQFKQLIAVTLAYYFK